QRPHFAARGERGAVHVPDIDSAGGGIAPNNVALAVAVEVTGILDLPVGRLRGDCALGGEGGAIHLPDIDLAGGGVAPQDVALAIAVEIPGALDLPVGSPRSGHPRRGDGGAVHVPDIDFAGGVIAPQQVALQVAVEVAIEVAADPAQFEHDVAELERFNSGEGVGAVAATADGVTAGGLADGVACARAGVDRRVDPQPAIQRVVANPPVKTILLIGAGQDVRTAIADH